MRDRLARAVLALASVLAFFAAGTAALVHVHGGVPSGGDTRGSLPSHTALSTSDAGDAHDACPICRLHTLVPAVPAAPAALAAPQVAFAASAPLVAQPVSRTVAREVLPRGPPSTRAA